jgi:hypothetical protein
MHQVLPVNHRQDGEADDRRALLQRLLPLWPSEIADGSIDNRRRIIRLLARALREERRRGVSGHWAYDLSRHAALARLYRQESDELAAALRAHCGQTRR